MNELAKIDSYRTEVAIAETIDEIKLLSTKGELLAEMAKKLRIPLKGQNELGKTRIELEKKKRELIEQMFPKGRNNQYSANSEDLSLHDVGITFNESSDAKIIKEEDELVNEVIREIEANNRDIITPKIVASKVRKKKSNKDRNIRAEQGKNISIDIDFRLGDFYKVLDDIPDGTVDCIITDPPYPREFIECWSKLSEFASRKLKKHGFCIAYSGQFNLPEVINRMSENLDYYWTFAVYHEGLTQIVSAVNLICRWKPVLIFQNGRKKLDNTFQDYFISEQREKQGHDWQQSISGVSYLIEMFTKSGELIVEPFAGAGTTIIASHNLGRNVIASEIDETVFNIAKSNINDQKKK